MSRLLDRPLGLAIIVIALLIIAGVAAPESIIEKIVHRGASTVNGLVTGGAPDATALTGVQTAGSPVTPAPSVGTSKPTSVSPFDIVFAVKKVGHFVLFGVLAFLAFSSATRRTHGKRATTSPDNGFVTTAAALLLFAAAAEVVQFLTTSRSPSLIDWSIDAAGIVLGATAALVLSHFKGNDVAAPDPAG
jgi:VanZ family protein